MTRAELHKLVDALPEAAVEAAGLLLTRAAQDPMIAVLDVAPLDDEPYTDEERAEDATALNEQGIPLEQARKELLG
ncbi:MAG: hypothetical protein ACREOM_04475 [Candidatus Dormibacteraceae bacterium]